MATKNKRIFLLGLTVVVVTLSALTFAATKPKHVKTPARIPPPTPSPQVGTNTRTANYVQRAALRPQLIPDLIELGDRVERPGQERLNVIGTLTRADSNRRFPFSAVIEFPDHVSLSIQEGAQTRVLRFDGQEVTAIGSAVDVSERDLIETLAYDTAEHFFWSQMQNHATRGLGSRFRADDGSARNYAGPYYDIYEMSELDKTSSDRHQSVKHFYFNSDTHLLERVRYEVTRGGANVGVEIIVEAWQKQTGQNIPRRIERRENNMSVFVLAINSVNVAPRVADGIFGTAASN